MELRNGEPQVGNYSYFSYSAPIDKKTVQFSSDGKSSYAIISDSSKTSGRLSRIMNSPDKYLKIGFKKVGIESLKMIKRIIPMTICMTIAMGVRNSNQPVSYPEATHAQRNVPTELYEAGRQHVLDSIKISELEKQVAELSQKVDSVNLTKKAGKLVKNIKK